MWSPVRTATVPRPGPSGADVLVLVAQEPVEHLVDAVDREVVGRPAVTASKPLSTSTRCTAVSWAIRRNQKPTVWSSSYQVYAVASGPRADSSSVSSSQPLAEPLDRVLALGSGPWSQSSSRCGPSGSRMQATLCE